MNTTRYFKDLNHGICFTIRDNGRYACYNTFLLPSYTKDSFFFFSTIFHIFFIFFIIIARHFRGCIICTVGAKAGTFTTGSVLWKQIVKWALKKKNIYFIKYFIRMWINRRSLQFKYSLPHWRFKAPYESLDHCMYVFATWFCIFLFHM